LIIPDGKPMSVRTLARRKKAAGLTLPAFRYPFNEVFFFTWTEELAWLIGLIWSDGCLFGNSIEICSKDRDMLETVATLIGQNEGIRPKNNGRAWRVVFSSKPVTDFLRSIGLTEKKSLTIDWPLIPKQWESSFLRGVLDGDGSVAIRHDREGQQVADCAIHFYTASPSFGGKMMQWLINQNITAQMRLSHTTVWTITIKEQSSVRKLYTLLYPCASVPTLHRKRAPFDKWMATARVRPGRPTKVR